MKGFFTIAWSMTRPFTREVMPWKRPGNFIEPVLNLWRRKPKLPSLWLSGRYLGPGNAADSPISNRILPGVIPVKIYPMMAYTVNYNDIARVEVFSSLEALSEAFLHRLSVNTMKAAGNGDDCYISLSGGSGPPEIYKRTPENWGSPLLLSKMKFYWGDERCVPPGSERSNFGNADRIWFSRLDVPGEHIHRIKGEDDPEEEAKRYEALLRKIPQKDGLPCFDFIMLGIGENGHTASIFPDDMDVLTSQRLVTSTRDPDSGEKRITLTGPVINNAKEIFFLVIGEKKEGVLRELFSGSAKARSYPAWHIRPKGILTWFLDSGAGGWLRQNQ